jgi:N4-gp56 family major capsid protein
MAITNLSDLIDPEVMQSIIESSLDDAIRFSPLADIDTTLEGTPGSTLTVPKWAYSGDAVDVAETVAIVPDKLTQSSTTFTIKKAGKGVEISDEALLSGLGDPIGEASKQIKMAIANKVDNDILTAAQAATQTSTGATVWDLDTISNAIDVFEDEEDNSMVLIMHPLDASKLRKAVANDWARASELGDNIIVKGVYGEVLNAQVIRSRKVTQNNAYLIKRGALKIFRKRNVLIEKDRDILSKTTVVTGDLHYGAYIYDESKIIKITITPV